MKPLIPAESSQLNQVSSYIPVIKLYTHRFLTAKTEKDFPVDMMEQLVEVLLDLINELGKGSAAPRRYDNVLDYCNEAVSMNESSFAALVGNIQFQKKKTCNFMCTF
jgi:hypothetical protein